MILLPAAVPVVPDGDRARALLQDELARPEYAAAQPSLFDRIANGFLEWFTGLFDTSRSGAAPILLVVALAVVVALLVVAVLLFGRPRVNRRSRAVTIFGEDDRRSAADLRRAAQAAFGHGDFALAVLERFRAIARSLDERTLVAVLPGTTAAGFARAAAAVFPEEGPALADAAVRFDGVRYADLPASREDAEALQHLDERLVATRPRLAAVPA